MGSRGKKMRLFIALKTTPYEDILYEKLKEIKPQFTEGIKWVSKENLHVTVKFLGEVKPDFLETTKSIVDEVAKTFKSFTFFIEGISGFPKPTYARVLFFSIKDEGHFIEFIMRMLDKEFEQHNFKREESYIPHITFGRVKYGFVDLSSKKFSDIKFTVQAYGLTLIESVLNPEGPTYNEIKYFNFVNNNV